MYLKLGFPLRFHNGSPNSILQTAPLWRLFWFFILSLLTEMVMPSLYSYKQLANNLCYSAYHIVW